MRGRSSGNVMTKPGRHLLAAVLFAAVGGASEPPPRVAWQFETGG